MKGLIKMILQCDSYLTKVKNSKLKRKYACGKNVVAIENIK